MKAPVQGFPLFIEAGDALLAAPKPVMRDDDFLFRSLSPGRIRPSRISERNRSKTEVVRVARMLPSDRRDDGLPIGLPFPVCLRF